MRFRRYHTPSTIPENVRPEVVKGWNRLWNRLRRRPSSDRALEFQTGTPLKIDGTKFMLRWIDKPEMVLGNTGKLHRRMWVWILWLGGHEREIEGACCFGHGKPYTYFDDLQIAVDELIAIEIMET